jgi:hypothetical protein
VTASHAGGIHTIEKPRCFIGRDIFLCRTCKGNHLSHLCPTTVRITESWFSLEGPSGSESSMVSPHYVISLVDTIVMLMQSLDETPFPLGVDASFDLVVSHPVQLVVMSMHYLTNTSPMFGGDASLDLVVSHIVQPTIVSMQSLIENTPGFGVTHLLTLLARILFNQWLKMWSCQ